MNNTLPTSPEYTVTEALQILKEAIIDLLLQWADKAAFAIQTRLDVWALPTAVG